MKKFTPLLLLLAFLSGCSSYQYLTIDSSQMQKNKRQQLSWENDTLRISYSFNGDHGPVWVTFFNKTTQPLYVNWKKSAFIRNESSVDLYSPQANFSGIADGTGYRFGGITTTRSTINAIVDLPEGIEFIPPSSGITKYLLSLRNTGPLLTHLPDSLPRREMKQEHGFMIRYKEMNFDEAHSLVRFKSYFTFVVGLNNGKEFAETNSFYVSRIMQTGKAPQYIVNYGSQSDQLYVRYK
jgi:hypothetical protein